MSDQYIEELIRDDRAERLSEVSSDYRVNPRDFADMVLRLSARVEYGPLDASGLEPAFVRLHTLFGGMRVQADAAVKRGEFWAVVPPDAFAVPLDAGKAEEREFLKHVRDISEQRKRDASQLATSEPVRMSIDDHAMPAWSSERSAGQLSFWLRRELLDHAVRALANNQPDIACKLISAYEVLMRAGL